MKIKRILVGVALASAVFSPSLGAADEGVVVLSSNLKPYQETLNAFQKTLDKPFLVIPLSERGVRIPFGSRVILAIGGKAALENHPRDVPLIYCLSPGVLLPVQDRTAPTVKIYMTPPAGVVLSTLRGLQPAMKRLGILSLAESRDSFNAQMQEIGQRQGIQIVIEKMRSPNDLPDRLRGLTGRLDALWIPPDPRLITPQNFNLIKEFTLSNHIAFYVPTVELVSQGATASVAASFDDIGREAGRIAKGLMSGVRPKESTVYPQRPYVALNLRSASRIGLKWTPEQIEKADKVVE